jgi:hypothetical protein
MTLHKSPSAAEHTGNTQNNQSTLAANRQWLLALLVASQQSTTPAQHQVVTPAVMHVALFYSISGRKEAEKNSSWPCMAAWHPISA